MTHISLDFWNTIGIPNPDYAVARNKTLSQLFSNLSEAEAGRIYAGVKATVDRTHSAECRPLDFRTVYALLHNTMSAEGHTACSMTPLHAILSIEFQKYPPKILTETVAELNRLKASGFTLSIGSNTNFIAGKVIRTVLPDVFTFKVFSDELGYAKPHAEFWREVERKAPDGEIFHIGDHPICDTQTGENIHPILIDSAAELPHILRNFG